ncbi:hypothetical protein K2X33_00980 [bacterium]|nr:hypothetical protein [bacterium]
MKAISTILCLLLGAFAPLVQAAEDTFLTADAPLLADDGVRFVFPQTSRTIVVGDVHADPSAVFEIARKTGLINPQIDWTGGDTRWILLGDLTSRGENSRLIFDLVRYLRPRAQSHGGDIHVVQSNHEAQKVEGFYLSKYAEKERLQYADFAPGFTAEDVQARIRELLEGGEVTSFTLNLLRMTMIDEYAKRSYIEAFRHPDSPYLQDVLARNTFLILEPAPGTRGDSYGFSHAGFDSWLFSNANRGYLAQINATVRGFLSEANLVRTGRREAPIEYHWTVNDEGPLFTRALAREELPASLVHRALDGIGVKTFFIGHHLNESARIEQFYNGRVWDLDTGISSAYRGSLSAVEILRGKPPQELYFQRPLGTQHPFRKTFEGILNRRIDIPAVKIDFEEAARSCRELITE